MSEYLKPQSPLYHKKEDTYFYPLTTVDQVIMDDGSRLNSELSKHLMIDIKNANEAEPNGINADTLGGYAADEYARKEDLSEYAKTSDLENLNTSGISMELLWENASPTSSFNTQTLSINLAAYNYLLVVCKLKNDVEDKHCNTILIDNYTYNLCATSGAVTQRTITVTSTSIAFGNGFVWSGSGLTEGAQYCIPLKIYGIKGVSK